MASRSSSSTTLYRNFTRGSAIGEATKIDYSVFRASPIFIISDAFMLQENNFAFIDSQNLNLAIQGLGWSLDFKKFRQYLIDRFSAQKTFLFLGYIAGNRYLYQSLQEYGYIIVFKPTLKLPNQKVKGNVDAELVLRVMIEYKNYGQAIIVTGGGDFYCLVEYLIRQQKLKRLIVPNKYKYSSLLRGYGDYITFLNGTQQKLGRQQKRGITAGRNPLGSLLS